LIISRTLVEIFSDDFLRENLAFRGGTALHKLYLNPAHRYSEDIDLVQIKEGPIKRKPSAKGILPLQDYCFIAAGSSSSSLLAG
jgi:predicted nucleotidyltransferase component of viral defense system